MTRKYATAERRFAGYLLDAVLMGLIVAAPIGLLQNLFAIDNSAPEGQQIDILAFQLIMGLGLLWWGLVVGVMEGGRLQGTPAKIVLGIKVADIEAEGPIGFWRAVLRWLVWFPSVWLLGLGVLPVFSNPRHQGWHDRASRSIVLVGRP